MRHLTLSLAMLVALAGSGCGPGRHVQKGINAFEAMQYQKAMAIWIDIEPQLPEMNAKGAMRYYVFRGLTHYRMGDQAMALRYLAAGQRAYQQGDPSWLPPHTVQQMQQAMAALQGGVPAGPPGGSPAPPPIQPGADSPGPEAVE